MSDLIKPKEFVIKDAEGTERKFILSNFPAVEGREIISKYPTAGLPKIGDYAISEDVMLKLMSYVAVEINGTHQRLMTRDMINNHCSDWETLAKVEMAMMEKNCSFFRDGRHWDFLENTFQVLLTKASEMLTRSSDLSSQPAKQPSTN